MVPNTGNPAEPMSYNNAYKKVKNYMLRGLPSLQCIRKWQLLQSVCSIEGSNLELDFCYSDFLCAV